MLHLAQVQKNLTSGKMELKLLACQNANHTWQIGESICLPLVDTTWGEGVLVLVKRGSQGEIISIEDAKDLVLSILETYSNENITPQFVAAEKEKVEQWRQEITSQSLELNRRALEIETRREELQELEQTLKPDQEKLANELKEKH